MAGQVALKPHQEEDVRWLLSRNGGILGHDVGGGKTYPAIVASLEAMGSGGKCLVVLPLRLMEQWAAAFRKFRPDISVQGVHAPDGCRAYDATTRGALMRASGSWDVLLVNYDLLPTLTPDLAAMARRGVFAALIVDEAHRLKGYRGQRARCGKQAKSLFGWSDLIPFRVGLTGTPILNGPEDAFGVLRVYGPEAFGDVFWAFENRFFYDVSRDRNYKILKLRASERSKFEDIVATHVRRLTRDDLRAMYPDDKLPEVLPPVLHYVDLPQVVARAYEDLRKTSIADIEGNRIERRHILGRGMALAMLSSGAFSENVSQFEGVDDNGEAVLTDVRNVHVLDMSHKFNAIRDIIESLPADAPVVLWAHFRHEIDALAGYLASLGIGAVSKVYGQQADAPQQIAAFQRGETRFFVGQPGTAGEGLNLQRAWHAIYLSRSYSPRDWKQSLGRLPRWGNPSPFVTIHLVLARNTIDTHIHEQLERKDGDARSLMRDDWLAALRRAS